MNSVILHHHLGLGDHFVCNGLVHQVSKQYDAVYLPCKIHNYETIKYLYSESSKIKIFKIYKDEFSEINNFSSLMNLKTFVVGFQHHDPSNWDRSFYDQLNINFIERYKSFYLPKKLPEKLIVLPKEKYILVHKQSSFGDYDLNIKTDLKIVKIVGGISDNLFSYIDIIKNASEIHCINSSVFHLIDSLSDVTKQLYYHDIRPSDGTKFIISKKWKMVK